MLINTSHIVGMSKNDQNLYRIMSCYGGQVSPSESQSPPCLRSPVCDPDSSIEGMLAGRADVEWRDNGSCGRASLVLSVPQSRWPAERQVLPLQAWHSGSEFRL